MVSLQEEILAIIGIDAQVLLKNYSGDISIAQRMSWASKKEGEGGREISRGLNCR
jgi:hypothetical protein